MRTRSSRLVRLPRGRARAELERAINLKHQALSQVGENEMVVAELQFLEEDAKVFKLIGPVLVQQDVVEVKANVSTRIEFIKKDMAKIDAQIKDYEKKAEEQRQKVRAPPRCCAVRARGGRLAVPRLCSRLMRAIAARCGHATRQVMRMQQSKAAAQ